MLRGKELACIVARFHGRWCAWVKDHGDIGRTFTRRCDAKRAAEVLVGQWWREKCEREAKPFTVADAVALVNDALASCGVAVVRPEGPVRAFALQYAAVDGVEARSGE